MQPPDRDGGWQEQVSSKASVIGHVGKALNRFNCSSLRVGLGRWMVDDDGPILCMTFSLMIMHAILAWHE